MQAREPIDKPACHSAVHARRQKITSASLRGRAQCTRVSYIRDVQPHQSMSPIVTMRASGLRVRDDFAVPVARQCASAAHCPGCTA
ncbi:hypothetical protein XHV734_4642 [Xanthomonas hortorum pv. vitians]|nr:hypothetical protein XHV734_4642 [Xanthomonas hortorum pv. vitians]